MDNLKSILLDYNIKGLKDYVLTTEKEEIEIITEEETTTDTNYYNVLYVGKDLSLKDNNLTGSGYILNIDENSIVMQYHDNISTTVQNIAYSNLDTCYIDLIHSDITMLYATLSIALLLLVTLIYNWLRSWFARIV